MDIKLDARNLIEADVKSALTDLDWFGKAAELVTAAVQYGGFEHKTWAPFLECQ